MYPEGWTTKEGEGLGQQVRGQYICEYDTSTPMTNKPVYYKSDKYVVVTSLRLHAYQRFLGHRVFADLHRLGCPIHALSDQSTLKGHSCLPLVDRHESYQRAK